MTNWRDIRARRVAPKDEPRMQAGKEAVLAENRLNELRKHRHITQAQVAERLNVRQPTISNVERGVDIKLSTLQNYVQALGGQLEIRAVFDDETVPIS